MHLFCAQWDHYYFSAVIILNYVQSQEYQITTHPMSFFICENFRRHIHCDDQIFYYNRWQHWLPDIWYQ